MYKLKRSRLIAIILCLILLLLSGCMGKKEKQVVNILSANYEEQIEQQLRYLRKLYPDAEINITYMSSGKLAAKVQAEGKDTEADIALSLSSAYANTLKEEGLLLAFTPESEYKEEYTDPDSMVLPNGVWCGVILCNTEELRRLGLPEPTSYEDLLKPIYKGHIVMANPNSSATGYFFLLGLINLYGEEAALTYFDRLSENIMLYGESGSVPSSMVEKGEAVIGLGIDYEGTRMASEGKPVKVVFAKEGVPYDYDTVLLLNHGDKKPSDFVLEIMKTITSAEGNAVFNNYNISVLKDGTNRVNYPDHFKLLDMTGITDSARKAKLSEIWSNRYE